MTDLEKMAREAGADITILLSNPPKFGGAQFTAAQLERFAQAVASRCAEICYLRIANTAFEPEAEACGDAIRAEFGLKETPDA